MDPLSKKKFIKHLGRSLHIIALIIFAYGIYLLIYNLYNYLYYINTIRTTEDLGYWLKIVSLKPIIYFIIAGVIAKIVRYIDKYADEYWKAQVAKIIGLIESYREIHISTLARKVGMSPKRLEEILALLKHEGLFKGKIDQNGFIHSSAEEEIVEPPVIAIQNIADMPRPEQPATTLAPRVSVHEAEGTVVVDESRREKETSSGESEPSAEDIEKKIKELEKAYKEGLISEETYRKMLEELRKPGTQR